MVKRSSRVYFSYLTHLEITYGTPHVVVRGRLESTADEIPTGHVSVVLHGTSHRGKVDGKGQFEVTLDASTLAAGRHVIELQHEGGDDVEETGATAEIIVRPATPNLQVSGGTFIYDGKAHPAEAAAIGVDGNTIGSDAGNLVVTHALAGSSGAVTDAPTDVGTYQVSVVFKPAAKSNYASAQGSGLIIIRKATPTVQVSGGTFSYNGNPQPAMAKVIGAGDQTLAAIAAGGTPSGSYASDLGITYTGSSEAVVSAPVNVGSYMVTARFKSTDPNHTDATGLGLIVITAPWLRDITGVVKTKTGVGVAGSPVKLLDVRTNEIVYEAITDLEGRYSIPSLKGSYKVLAGGKQVEVINPGSKLSGHASP